MALRLNPSAESFTAVAESSDANTCLISQVLHKTSDRSARLNFLVTANSTDINEVLELWDYLNGKAGEMGASNVLAEVSESSPVFESLRKAGFSPYGWESAWKLPKKINLTLDSEHEWAIAVPTDEPQLRSLYQSLVPPIVQAAEAFSNGGTRRLVYRENDEIVAFVESSTGPNGLYLRPLIHPAVLDISALLNALFSQFTDIGQPVYLQVRSYQAWLLNTLEIIGGESSSQFTLLVKHLAILQRNGVIITNGKLVNNRQVEPSAPMVSHLSVDEPPSPH
ncbi:MAG: hypothetical protein CVU42_03205 [Chloroflexi bacterium HGW-Chloroflexi-4]|nr:MAG: hypothetical protein CVU42_03205 [Chloroflexi bacterium HGW-Chloroflexi-4]